jgi:pimeloyl-ACP methyl ester carboxylesterase
LNFQNLSFSRRFASLFAAFALLAAFLATQSAIAQKEFPPPQGKGRIVVVASGMSGPEHYEVVSKEIAALGYDVVLFDGNAMENTNGEGVRTAIDQGVQAAHGLPGKVAFVGFSLGGGMGLYYAVQEPEKVAGVIAWYPANAFIKNVPGWVDKVKVPVLMFAGEKDNFRDGCCTAAKAHILEDAAKSGSNKVELFTYPKTDHDFVKDGAHYNASAYADAFQRTAARLKELLGDPNAPAAGQ